mmetsp:Transcript_9979/g.15064  ORF Transcript_9979/g.15064 Transcript_9979/m.15064 type:complete len:337 (-) Transcript_9979:283-1293(-)
MASRCRQAFKKVSSSTEGLSGYSGSVSAQAMWYNTVTGLLNCAHGVFPVVISIVVHPSDHTSAFFQLRCFSSFRTTSGAIKDGVPRTSLEPVLRLLTSSFCPCGTWTAGVSTGGLQCLLAPKSASFIAPSFPTKQFAPLTSLWAIPFLCKYSSPSKSCRVYDRATDSSSLPNLSMRLFSDPPGTYSRKTERVVGVSSVPIYRTIFGCFRDLRVLISLSNWASSFFDMSSMVICFTAISSPVSTLRPRHTTPKAPFPSISPFFHFQGFSTTRGEEVSICGNLCIVLLCAERSGATTVGDGASPGLGLALEWGILAQSDDANEPPADHRDDVLAVRLP